MAVSELTIVTGQVTPKNVAGPRVELGGRAYVKRVAAGSFGIQVLRGDGGDPEAYTYTVRAKLMGPYSAGEEVFLDIGCEDLYLPDYTPRSYQMRISTLDGSMMTVRNAFLAPAPYAEAGTGGT